MPGLVPGAWTVVTSIVTVAAPRPHQSPPSPSWLGWQWLKAKAGAFWSRALRTRGSQSPGFQATVGITLQKEALSSPGLTAGVPRRVSARLPCVSSLSWPLFSRLPSRRARASVLQGHHRQATSKPRRWPRPPTRQRLHVPQQWHLHGGTQSSSTLTRLEEIAPAPRKVLTARAGSRWLPHSTSEKCENTAY